MGASWRLGDKVSIPMTDSEGGLDRWPARRSWRRRGQSCTVPLRAAWRRTWNLDARNRLRRRHHRKSPKPSVTVPSVQIWIDVGLSGSGPLTTQRPCLLPSTYGPSWTAPPT